MTNYTAALAAALASYRLDTLNRPLRLVVERPGAQDECALLPQQVSGSESVCGGFTFHILCVSESATLSLKDYIGVPIELQVVTDSGNLRRWCGIVTGAASGQSDGGLGTYKLTMRDALAVMEGQTNTRVFLEKNELEIIELLFKGWQRKIPALGATFALHIDAGLLNRPPPRRGFTMQHNESDAGFVRRLLQRRGIAWFFRPGLADAQRPVDGRASPRIGHSLVLFDDTRSLARTAAASVRFHRDAATEQRDTITAWSAERTLVPGNTALHSWDYLQPAGAGFMMTGSPTHADQGQYGNELAAGLEDYRAAAPRIGDGPHDLQALGNTQMARHEYAAKCFHGEGSVRDLAVGEWFSFEGHPEISTHPATERQFVVTAQHIVATNNLPAEITARVGRLFARSGWDGAAQAAVDEAGHSPQRYRTSFSCVRRSVRIVPPAPVLPQAQLQTAIVVGRKTKPSGAMIWGGSRFAFPRPGRRTTHTHPAPGARIGMATRPGYVLPPAGPATDLAPATNAARA